MFEVALAGDPIDLGLNQTDAALDEEPGLMLASARDPSLLSRYNAPPRRTGLSTQLNPLYRKLSGSRNEYELAFPSEEYAEEFAAARRYLPDRVDPDALDLVAAFERRILLDLPENYL